MLLKRARIEAAIARSSRLPVTLIVAPAGSGKSVAIRQHLDSAQADALHFDVRPSTTSLTQFVRGLAATFEPVLPKVTQSLAIAHERATNSAKPAEELAAWVAEHLGNVERTIVLDNFHHCEGDAAIAAFVACAIERTRKNAHWIISTRSTAELPLAIWLARRDAEVPIDESVLELTADEAEQLASAFTPALDFRVVHKILRATNASIGATVFALRTSAKDSKIATRALNAGGSTFERFVDEALKGLVPQDRRLLTESALFPDLDETLFVAAGYKNATERLVKLRASIPQVFVEYLGRPRYQTLFSDLMVTRLAEGGASGLSSALSRTGNALESADRIAEALTFYIRARDFTAIARVVDAQALAYVDAGYGDTIAEAIEHLDPIVQTSSPAILATKATFESRLGRFDTAESWFQLAIDRSTDAAVRNRICYQYGTHLLRFLRPEAIGLLERLASEPGVSADLRCYAFSALGPAYMFDRRPQDASTSASRALKLLDGSDNPHLRARAYHQAAFVALFRNDGVQARLLASNSLAIANEHGFFDIAAGALTVLYNAAADIEDDPAESMRLLDAVADNAAKSGSLLNHLLALVAKLEIEVERGDEDAIAALDSKLQSFDVRCSGRAVYEALLPAQALRASWTGDYAGAYHLLASSSEQQWSADRKALRWAEVAAYAAAATLTNEASAAIRSSLELLPTLESSPRVARARLFLAFAMILLGRREGAEEMLALVDAEREVLSSRLEALRRAFEALCDRYRGERNHQLLLGRLQSLEEEHFGGVARMVKTSPLADNATLRSSTLTTNDRRAVEQLATDAAFQNKRRGERIIAKLGCVDRRAVVRAVARHPALAGAAIASPSPTEA